MFDKLIDVLLTSIKVFQFFDVINTWERGVVCRFGKPHRDVEPGFIWILPFFIEKVWSITTVPDVEKLDGQTLTTEDGKIVTLRGVVTYKVVDARKALLEVTTVKSSLEDACSGEIGRLVSETAAENLTAARFWSRLTRACQSRAGEWGIEIVRVQLSDVAISRNIRLWTESTSSKES